MEKFRPKEKIDDITDMQLVLHWVKEIEEPCEDGKGNNVRSVYLREAKTILANRKFENPYAREMLENTVKKYETK